MPQKVLTKFKLSQRRTFRRAARGPTTDLTIRIWLSYRKSLYFNYNYASPGRHNKNWDHFTTLIPLDFVFGNEQWWKSNLQSSYQEVTRKLGLWALFSSWSRIFENISLYFLRPMCSAYCFPRNNRWICFWLKCVHVTFFFPPLLRSKNILHCHT